MELAREQARARYGWSEIIRVSTRAYLAETSSHYCVGAGQPAWVVRARKKHCAWGALQLVVAGHSGWYKGREEVILTRPGGQSHLGRPRRQTEKPKRSSKGGFGRGGDATTSMCFKGKIQVQDPRRASQANPGKRRDDRGSWFRDLQDICCVVRRRDAPFESARRCIKAVH